MNVIISNEMQNQLTGLDIDIIKSLTGSYEALEIVEMFKSFFYNRMIIDVTALKRFGDVKTYDLLVHGLDPEKIIFILPEGTSLCTPNFLSHLISLGIYNFTTNIAGVKYLLKNPNSYENVEQIRNMANVESSSETGAVVTNVPSSNTPSNNAPVVIGVRSVTDGAGATTFIYLLKKELSFAFGQNNVLAIELDKNDFRIFRDKNMISIKSNAIQSTIEKYYSTSIILIDLNGYNDDSFCGDVLYLIEPSTIKLNKLVMSNSNIFQTLKGKKVVLNQSLLLNNDVSDFESETGIKVFYNLPPLDDRKRNSVINDFLSKLGVFKKIRKGGSSSNKIFGLFRR